MSHPEPINRTRTKIITLNELHTWIVMTRKIQDVVTRVIHPGPAEPLTRTDVADTILIKGDDNDKIKDITDIRIEFDLLLDHINEFDCKFHDLFDCRHQTNQRR